MPKIIKTRFAPSPTGYIHLGNVRTALFNWLCAKSQQGSFLLRIEDTDKERSRPEFVEALKRDLLWLGLEWQEGPDVGGSHAPYFQSQREIAYEKYYNQLIKQDDAYPCFCTARELEVSRKVQRASGHAPRYAGTCAGLSAQEVETKKRSGLESTLRFRVPKTGKIVFDDLVRGQQRFECQDIGDFIIRRSDGSPAFFFSNAIDDSMMAVSTVLRGEDHLTNTPRQLLILQALDLVEPEYGHISLIVNDQGGPLSKRDGSLGVQELREQGYLPIAIVNYLSRLGHHFSSEAYMSLSELAAGFALPSLGKAPARYQKSQLDYWQREAIANAEEAVLWQWMKQAEKNGVVLDAIVPADSWPGFARAIQENVTLPIDALYWGANLYSESGIYDDKAIEQLRQAGKPFFTAALDILQQDSQSFKEFSKKLGQQTSCKGKQLFMPLRAALSGELYAKSWHTDWMRGPQMADLWELLGKAVIERRFKFAAEL